MSITGSVSSSSERILLSLWEKSRSRRCNFFPWDKGQCPHGALFHAVPVCCKCFQQCRIAGTSRVGTFGSYPTLLEALATRTLGQRGTMIHGDTVPCPRSKVASSEPTLTDAECGLSLRAYNAASVKSLLQCIIYECTYAFICIYIYDYNIIYAPY